jgi:(E)-4-hydroxy-3-methylbut-2-enyl-diphosphate synthase
LLSEQTDYPLHLGVTEAGTRTVGTVRSSVALGILLAEGIGDTIRVSLTDTPHQEVKVGQAILRSLGLKAPGPSVVSCPTCGRTEIDLVALAKLIESALEEHYQPGSEAPCPVVAVMGCVVNGPGEARCADIAVCGGKGKGAIYVRGEHVETVPEQDIVSAVLKQIDAWSA